MLLAKRSVTAISLALCALAALPEASRAQTTVEVYPGPGVDTYKSNLYRVEVFDGTNWVPAYVYHYSRKSFTHWHSLDSPTVSFTTFGTTGPVNVRVSKLGGAITDVNVYPTSKEIKGKLAGGQAIGTLNPNDKLWLIINGDDANPLFVFADAPKPCVPPGATYFGPGIREIAPATNNHYKASTSEVIYLDGGAWVRGNIDVTGTRNVRIMGPGVLSGDLWIAENVQSLPSNQFSSYAMVTGDFYGGDGASVSGITIVDSPGYAFYGGATNVYGVKVLSPWFYGTDAFLGVSHIDHIFCFNGDEVFTPQWAGVQGDNATITSSFVATANNTVFAGGYWGFEAFSGYGALADDIDVLTYNNDDWGPPLTAGVFQIWVDNSDSTKGYARQTYQNIRVDNINLSVPLLSVKNVVYPWGGQYAVNPPLGNSSNLVFKNVSATPNQK